mmetsp:Transcript_13051/g.38306  ORF Transcript_13051/g.38306 Transcript_13051/m.38306 type:complete len:210 (+) Transcript_13051:1084-1713(+)
MKLKVLADEDADADAADVKGVQKLVHLWVLPDLGSAQRLLIGVALSELDLELVHAAGHLQESGRVSIVDLVEHRLEGDLLLGGGRRLVANEVVEGLDVPVTHSPHRGHVGEAVGQLLELDRSVSEPNGEFVVQKLGDLYQCPLLRGQRLVNRRFVEVHAHAGGEKCLHVDARLAPPSVLRDICYGLRPGAATERADTGPVRHRWEEPPH